MARLKRPKAKGYRSEKRIAAQLGGTRNWFSGSLPGARGDVTLDHALVQRVEVKARASGWPVLRRWLAQGDAHALVLDEGARVEPLVVIPLRLFKDLLDYSAEVAHEMLAREP